MGFLASKNTQETTLRFPVEKGYAEIFGLRLPINPMIGVRGLAPKKVKALLILLEITVATWTPRISEPGAQYIFLLNKKGHFLLWEIVTKSWQMGSLEQLALK